MDEYREINLVIFKAEGLWIAQCLEIDFAVQAESEEDLPHQFAAAIKAEIDFCLDRDIEPFSGLPRAPERYWAMWRGSRVPEQGQASPWERLTDGVTAALRFGGIRMAIGAFATP
jgi:hypothetical protein